MKIDLTPREMELMLMLLNDAASEEFVRMSGFNIFSMEELSLMDKLENALKQEITEKGLPDIKVSTLRH